ncbi:MAG: NADH-dependent flavin oxidoreductase [Fimbriimonadaceae bacterium]
MTADQLSPVDLPFGLRLRNRLVVAPMTTYSSLENGNISPDELPYLARRAEGGFGMVMTAACAVHPRGKAFDGQWACWSDEFLDSLTSAAQAIKSHGAAAVLQIHHGGRQCPSRLCGGTPLSASAIPAERPNAETPAAMTEAEIEETIAAFAKAAIRAKLAGFDGVETHGANTYLLQQFVSPHSNRREDMWGDDRLRFPLAVTDAVVNAVPDYPVGYRFSPEELETPGIRLDQTEELLNELCKRPLAWLHISLRDFRQESAHGSVSGPILAHLHRVIAGRLPFIGVGAVKSLANAQECLETGCELVAVGRGAIYEPDFAKSANPRTQIPAEGAAEKLVLPSALATKIYNTPGWFDVEEPTPSDHVTGKSPATP